MLVSININTETQECLLVIDGQLVLADQISFYKGTDGDANPVKLFEYIVQVTEPDGMMKKMTYQMVPKDSPEYIGSKEGMATKEIKTKDKLYKEVEAFVNESSAVIKVMKNGTEDTPYCVMQEGKKIKCYKMMKDAQDHMRRIMNE